LRDLFSNLEFKEQYQVKVLNRFAALRTWMTTMMMMEEEEEKSIGLGKVLEKI
jgi:hypothetical protein